MKLRLERALLPFPHGHCRLHSSSRPHYTVAYFIHLFFSVLTIAKFNIVDFWYGRVISVSSEDRLQTSALEICEQSEVNFLVSATFAAERERVWRRNTDESATAKFQTTSSASVSLRQAHQRPHPFLL
jgi:hypothetical protein